MVLTLVNTPTDTKKTGSNPTDEKLGRIQGEIVSLLEDKIEELRRESLKVQATMEQALYRMNVQGFDLKLDDLRSGRWHRVAAEVRILQDVMGIVKSHK